MARCNTRADAESARDAEAPRNAEQAFRAIELVILARVNDVEAGGPERHGGGQPQNPRIERAAYRDPGRGRCDAQAKSKNQVREQGEAFGEGIEEQDRKRDRRENESTEKPSCRAAQIKIRLADSRKAPGEASRQQTGRRVPLRGTRIARVDIGVQKPVERHGGGAGRHHRYYDPEETPSQASQLKPAIAPGQQRAGQRKRQRKNGVLELDHVECQTQTCPEARHFPGSSYHFRGCRAFTGGAEYG